MKPAVYRFLEEAGARRLVATLVPFLWLASSAAAAPTAPLVPCVRQVDYVVLTMTDGSSRSETQSLFVLYVGNEETELLDRLAEHTGVTKAVCMVHSAAAAEGAGGPPEVAARAGGHGWYLSEIDSERGIVRNGPLLERAAWQRIPLLARQAYLALQAAGESLVLISWNGVSGSLSIYFAPSVQADRRFCDDKLELLRTYLEAHGQETDVPFQRVDPSGPTGTLTSS
jgi:hypothetical protein